MAKYARILDIRKVETKNGPKAKIQWGKGVEVYVDGTKVDFGEYNSVFLTTKSDKEEFLNRMVDAGKMKQTNVDRELEYLESKNISSLVDMKIED